MGTEGLKFPREVDPKTGYLMPYHKSDVSHAILPEHKVKFLEIYTTVLNGKKAAKHLGFTWRGFRNEMDKDPKFRADFLEVKMGVKEDIEEVMQANALTPKGFMDRMAWLRANFPEQYNPKATFTHEGGNEATIKSLESKLKEYDLIPKSKVIDIDAL